MNDNRTKFNKCALCEKNIMTLNHLSFRKCLNTHGKNAHRYCNSCWFEKIVPLSEEIHLKCYGCERQFPLWFIPKTILDKTIKVQIIEIED